EKYAGGKTWREALLPWSGNLRAVARVGRILLLSFVYMLLGNIHFVQSAFSDEKTPARSNEM
ncbi:MAG: hypothetical protein RR588_15395, partial [Solibacillus sp.]